MGYKPLPSSAEGNRAGAPERSVFTIMEKEDAGAPQLVGTQFFLLELLCLNCFVSAKEEGRETESRSGVCVFVCVLICIFCRRA